MVRVGAVRRRTPSTQSSEGRKKRLWYRIHLFYTTAVFPVYMGSNTRLVLGNSIVGLLTHTLGGWCPCAFPPTFSEDPMAGSRRGGKTPVYTATEMCRTPTGFPNPCVCPEGSLSRDTMRFVCILRDRETRSLEPSYRSFCRKSRGWRENGAGRGENHEPGTSTRPYFTLIRSSFSRMGRPPRTRKRKVALAWIRSMGKPEM